MSDPLTSPLPVIANVSRVVTRAIDLITGDRVEFPLLVAAAGVAALKNHGIESRIMYGPAAWIEVMEDQSVLWAGCWGKNFHFWIASQFGEVIDLNASVAHKKRAHDRPGLKPIHSPPILWSIEVPKFYRYVPEGVAELELTEESDRRRYERALEVIQKECTPAAIQGVLEPEFPNEPILCPNRRLLDDSKETFRHFDRAVSVSGIPPAPI